MFAVVVVLCACATVLLVAQPPLASLFIVLAVLCALGAAFLRRLRLTPDVQRIYVVGAALRVAATAIAYLVVVPAYNGGDTLSYYRRGLDGAAALLDGRMPVLRVFPGTGTIDFVSSALEVVIPGPPSAVGLVFAFLAWCGCVLFCEALLQGDVVSTAAASLFRLLVMALPSILLWPSVQGKDGLVIFGAGLATYGALHIGRRRAPAIAVGLVVVLLVRPHIAVLLLTAMVVSPVSARTPEGGKRGGGAGRVAVLLLLVAVVVPVALQFVSTRIGAGSILQLTSDLNDRTSYGGSSFSPPDLASPTGLLLALPTAYFRPTLFEAGTPALLLSSLESTLLALAALALVFRRGVVGRILASPRHRYCLVLTIAGGLLLALLGNFGLLVRQRVLFEMCLLYLTIAPPVATRVLARPVARPAHEAARAHRKARV